MKNKFFTYFRLLAVVLVLGLAFGACDDTNIGKLEKLPSNATRADVEATMDEILDHPKSSEIAKADLRQLKMVLNDNTSDDYWESHRKLYIEEINEKIPPMPSLVDMFVKNKDFITPILSIVSIVFALIAILISIIVSFIKGNRDDKNKMYLRLEFASIEFFKWEAENRIELVKIRQAIKDKWEEDNVKDYIIPNNIGMRKQIEKIITPEEDILLETWCTQGLNLFELMIENTLEGKFPVDIFGTWLPWIFEFAKEYGFKQMWRSRLWLHYSSDCGTIIDKAIEISDKSKFITEIKKENKKFKHLDMEVWINN